MGKKEICAPKPCYDICPHYMQCHDADNRGKKCRQCGTLATEGFCFDLDLCPKCQKEAEELLKKIFG